MYLLIVIEHTECSYIHIFFPKFVVLTRIYAPSASEICNPWPHWSDTNVYCNILFQRVVSNIIVLVWYIFLQPCVIYLFQYIVAVFSNRYRTVHPDQPTYAILCKSIFISHMKHAFLQPCVGLRNILYTEYVR